MEFGEQFYKAELEDDKYYEVTIVADVNDGDYVTRVEMYSCKDFNERIVFYLYLLKKYAGKRGDLTRLANSENELFEEMNEWEILSEVGVPYGTYGDIAHTLDSISIRKVYNGRLEIISLLDLPNRTMQDDLKTLKDFE